MRFKSLKSITLGKQKKEPDKDEDKFKAIASDRIANMEKRIHGRTKELEEKAKQIQNLSPESDISELNGDIPKGPHGPLIELTPENDAKLDEEIKLSDVIGVDESDDEDDEDGIKLVEVSTASVIPPEIDEEAKATDSNPPENEGEAQSAEAGANPPDTPEKKDELKLDDSSDSLGDLFGDEEEEENPLANLIKSLPDVSAQEIIDDLNEIKGIIKEWQKK